MRVRFINSPALSRVLALLVAIAGVMISGCYKHVVRVSGPGSDAYDVHEPNMQTPEQERRNAEAAPNKVAPAEKAKE